MATIANPANKIGKAALRLAFDVVFIVAPP